MTHDEAETVVRKEAGRWLPKWGLRSLVLSDGKEIGVTAINGQPVHQFAARQPFPDTAQRAEICGLALAIDIRTRVEKHRPDLVTWP